MSERGRPRDPFARALAFCHAQRLFARGDRVLVGLGGGAVSLGLLGFLSAARDSLGLSELAVGSIEVHGELSDDAESVAEVGRAARQLGLSFYAVRPTEGLRVALSHELSLLASAQGFHRVALGHCQDDDARRVLAELCLGDGLLGLRGLRPKPGRAVVRPLLRLSSVEAASLASSLDIELPRMPPAPPRGLEARLDATVLPRLRALVPEVTLCLAALGREARGLRRSLLREARALLASGRRPDGSVEIAPLRAQPALSRVLSAEILRALASGGSELGASQAQVERRLARMIADPDKSTVLLAGALSAEHDRTLGVIRLVPRRHRRAQRASGDG